MIDFAHGIPSGGTTDLVTVEKELGWGGTGNWPWQFLRVVFLSSTTDAGNTPTTTLRKGLAVGRITATGKWGVHSATATNGLEIPLGILAEDVNMLNPASGSAEDKMAIVIVAGPVRANQVVSITSLIRQGLYPRVLFDDLLSGNNNPWYGGPVAKAADYTVVVNTDNGKIFTTLGATGAIIFTLPAIGSTTIGERYKFINEVDQNMTITAPANKLVIFNNLTATSGVFSTAGNKIGAICQVYANSDGTKWIFEQLCKHTLTVA